jgi:hypothetical protein
MRTCVVVSLSPASCGDLALNVLTRFTFQEPDRGWQECLKQKSPVLGHTNTKMKTKNNDLKPNTDSPNHSGTKLTTDATARLTLHRSSGLKLLIAITSVVAIGLSYQAVNEAIAVNRLLDQCQEAMGVGRPIQTPVAFSQQITETNLRVAGL